jgi:lipopolysaccharide export system permease protein
MLSTTSISLSKFFKFTSYLSIDIIAVILPISLAISAAFVYQRFVESNQLIALQAAGISPEKILSPLLVLAAIITVYLYANNAYVSPMAWKEFRAQEFNIKNNIDPPENAGSIFSANGFSIYANRYVGNLYFMDVFIIDARNADKTYAYFAKSGTIRNNILMLVHGERIDIDFETHKNSLLYFKAYNCNLKEIFQTENRAAQANEKFIYELLTKNDDEELTLTQTALFHQKMTAPMLAIIFSLLAFILIILAPYRRKSSYLGMVALVSIIIIIQGTFFWIANASAKEPKFISLNYALIAFAISILIVLIARCRRL